MTSKSKSLSGSLSGTLSASKIASVPSRKPTLPLEEASNSHIESDTVESFISDKRIGQRIKQLRQKKSMGLVDLGRHTGLSASFLSQLETGRVVPTLRNLARISMVFSKDLSYFFEPEPQTFFRIHRVKDRLRLPQSGVDDPMYFFESLGYLVPDRELDPYLAEFLPHGGSREPNPHQHYGCEFLYVLKGDLKVCHGDVVHNLSTGDAVYFDSSTIHSYSCAGDKPATALIVTLQRQLGASSANPGRRGPQRVASSPTLLRAAQK
jgi:transcriptional regulator with XRE-family HTH domain